MYDDSFYNDSGGLYGPPNEGGVPRSPTPYIDARESSKEFYYGPVSSVVTEPYYTDPTGGEFARDAYYNDDMVNLGIIPPPPTIDDPYMQGGGQGTRNGVDRQQPFVVEPPDELLRRRNSGAGQRPPPIMERRPSTAATKSNDEIRATRAFEYGPTSGVTLDSGTSIDASSIYTNNYKGNNYYDMRNDAAGYNNLMADDAVTTMSRHDNNINYGISPRGGPDPRRRIRSPPNGNNNWMTDNEPEATKMSGHDNDLNYGMNQSPDPRTMGLSPSARGRGDNREALFHDRYIRRDHQRYDDRRGKRSSSLMNTNVRRRKNVNKRRGNNDRKGLSSSASSSTDDRRMMREEIKSLKSIVMEGERSKVPEVIKSALDAKDQIRELLALSRRNLERQIRTLEDDIDAMELSPTKIDACKELEILQQELEVEQYNLEDTLHQQLGDDILEFSDDISYESTASLLSSKRRQSPRKKIYNDNPDHFDSAPDNNKLSRRRRRRPARRRRRFDNDVNGDYYYSESNNDGRTRGDTGTTNSVYDPVISIRSGNRTYTRPLSAPPFQYGPGSSIAQVRSEFDYMNDDFSKIGGSGNDADDDDNLLIYDSNDDSTIITTTASYDDCQDNDNYDEYLHDNDDEEGDEYLRSRPRRIRDGGFDRRNL